MSKDFKDQLIRKLTAQVSRLELRLREETPSRGKNKLVRESNEYFVENRELRAKLRAKLNRSIDPAYIVAVCKAITGETNE